MLRPASLLGVLCLLFAACGEGGGRESQVVEDWDDFLARHEWQLCEVVPHGVPPSSPQLAPEARAELLERVRKGAFHEGEHFYCMAGADLLQEADYALLRDAAGFLDWSSARPAETLWVPYVDGAYRDLPAHWQSTEDFVDGWFRLQPMVKLAIIGCDDV